MESSPEKLYEMYVIVKGLVQGVGFRAMTRSQALKLGLKGSVRNLNDGTVEIYAQGPKPRLEKLIENLKKETNPGQITETFTDYFSIKTPFEDFRILY
jgi:acylphosphatase